MMRMEIYKAQQTQQQPGGGQPGAEQPHANGNGEAKKDEAVTDVDFEEVKDDKKK